MCFLDVWKSFGVGKHPSSDFFFFLSGLDIKELPFPRGEARRSLESTHLSLLLLWGGYLKLLGASPVTEQLLDLSWHL